jgi:hypothetical protein
MFGKGPRGVFVLASGLLAHTFTVVAQQPQNPPTGGATPPGAPPQGGPGGRGAPMWEADFSKKGTVPVLLPTDEIKRIWMQPGFKLEPVLSDPDIQEPAQIAFDGNGRMFVLEIRGYMQDAPDASPAPPPARAKSGYPRGYKVEVSADAPPWMIQRFSLYDVAAGRTTTSQ